MNNKKIHHKSDYPHSLDFVLTKECNLDCIMCTRVMEESFTLPRSIFDKVWHIFPYINNVSWQGGEVFLIPYFVELLGKLCEEHPNIRHSIITNGQSLGREFIDLFTKYNIGLMFSIDSVSKEIYESIRLGGSFDRLLSNLTALCERTTSGFAANVVVMRRNMHELSLFPDFCRQYNIKDLRFSALTGFRASGEYCLGDPHCIQQLARTVVRVENKCLSLGIRFSCDFMPILKKYICDDRHQSQIKKESDGNDSFYCNRPWKNLYIFSDGSVKPACECSKYLGNLIEDSFDEIWNGIVMDSYRRHILDRSPVGWCTEQCLRGIINPEYSERLDNA